MNVYYAEYVPRSGRFIASLTVRCSLSPSENAQCTRVPHTNVRCAPPRSPPLSLHFRSIDASGEASLGLVTLAPWPLRDWRFYFYFGASVRLGSARRSSNANDDPVRRRSPRPIHSVRRHFSNRCAQLSVCREPICPPTTHPICITCNQSFVTIHLFTVIRS